MQDKQYDQNRSTHEQKNNPEKLGVNDEAQRTANQSGQRPKETPIGNEPNQRNETDGAEAGMGE